MRADRLVALVLLLRQRGRMTAAQLAEELEVSPRTVLRDVEALAVAGVTIEAERGRYGGFTIDPGLRTELTGLTQDEALALLAAGTRHGAGAFGLGSALASAMLKVLDALPPPRREAAAGARRRLLLDPEVDLLSRRVPREDLPDAVVAAVRRAVLDGRRLSLLHAAPGGEPRRRTVDPVGLVTVRDLGYLLALRDGEDRTYRLSRIREATVLDEPARRPDDVDLEREWRERSARFRAGDGQLAVRLLLHPRRREELLDTALAVLHEEPGPPRDPERQLLEVTFQDLRHAEWALWQLGTDAVALTPDALRDALRERAAAFAAAYARPRPD